MRFLALAVIGWAERHTETYTNTHTDKQTDLTEVITYLHKQMIKHAGDIRVWKNM